MSFSRATLTMFSSVLIWAAHFLVIYSTTGIACARPSSDDYVPWVIGIATLAAVLALWAATRSAGKLDPFGAWMTIALAALVFVAVIWEASAVLIVPVCS